MWIGDFPGRFGEKSVPTSNYLRLDSQVAVHFGMAGF